MMNKFTILGTNISIENQIFGALSQNSLDPLSRVSVANSSFSLDPFSGCPLKCAYCSRAGAKRDLLFDYSLDSTHPKVSLPTNVEKLFSGKRVATALINHPFFIENKSIVSVGTASTEAFLPNVSDETWNIFQTFIGKQLHNPFWIVTKMGIPDSMLDMWLDRFRVLRGAGIRLILSISFSDMPEWIEPYRGDRFRNAKRILSTGVRISHHLRPIIKGVNDSIKAINQSILASKDIAEAYCVGALRTDPGVKFAWSVLSGLDSSILPAASRKKSIPVNYLNNLSKNFKKNNITPPIFTRSSEAISYLLGITDYNLHRYRSNDLKYFLNIPKTIRDSILIKHNQSVEKIVEETAKTIGLKDVSVKAKGDNLVLSRDLSFQDNRVLTHAVGHSSLLP